MTDLERLRAERINLLSDMVQSLRREHAITREDLERAQQALRDIIEKIPRFKHYRGCECSECAWWAELGAIAKRGLEGP